MVPDRQSSTAIRERVLDQRASASEDASSASCARRWPSTGSGSSRRTRRRPRSARELAQLFERQVFPVLTPLVIGRGRPFPYISNLSLSLAVVLRDPEKDNEILARVKVPKELLRPLPQRRRRRQTLVPLDALIAANLGSLFPGMEVLDHSLFRVTRDTDYDVSDEADDLLQAVEEELRRRRFGEVVRLEIDADMSERLRDQLIVGARRLGRRGLRGRGPARPRRPLGRGRPSRPRRPARPAVHAGRPRRACCSARRARRATCSPRSASGDILVHHPYDSFTTTVERFVKQAVSDPDVLAIKQTVYRTSADSPLVPGLIEAAERGKQAVCLVELKARFDESANIRWAKKLEQAGVHVVYGIPALKTHVKCVLVVRREGDGVRHYVHIGTGNYNPKTARIYTDLGPVHLRPGDRRRHRRDVQLADRLRAPAQLPRGAGRAVQPAEGASSRRSSGRSSRTRPRPRARIRLKMNSLLDAPSIRALYRASQAGVEVRDQRPRDLRPAPRRAGRLGEHRRCARSSGASSSTRGSTRSSATASRRASTSAPPT